MGMGPSVQAWLHPSTPRQPSLSLTTWSHSSHGCECVVFIFSDSNAPPRSPKLSYMKECAGRHNLLGNWGPPKGRGSLSPTPSYASSLAPAPPDPPEPPPLAFVLQRLRPLQMSVFFHRGDWQSPIRMGRAPSVGLG